MILYLSRVHIDATKRKALKALSAPSLFHGALSESFEGERPHTLWRIDSLGGELYIIVLSETKPDLVSFCEQFSDTNHYETKEYDGLMSRITAGSRWRFRLTANPTRSICSNKGERGKVVAHITPEYQRNWLIEKGRTNGFAVSSDSFDIVQCKWQRFYKKGEKYVTLLSVTYEGVIDVTNPELFRNALVNGIGRGKAYGMGLMTVMRV